MNVTSFKQKPCIASWSLCIILNVDPLWSVDELTSVDLIPSFKFNWVFNAVGNCVFFLKMNRINISYRHFLVTKKCHNLFAAFADLWSLKKKFKIRWADFLLLKSYQNGVFAGSSIDWYFKSFGPLNAELAAAQPGI